ncbi:MAG: 1-deoxy-D-xylulose-5-phosphate reductoisomerase [Deltaproteobacteria bacterium]|nr:1-deoxy-D-xylulose-5-phosphate reductoisomerase [Deltaproteobacteria bacterium]
MLVPRQALRSIQEIASPIRVAIFGSTGSIGKSALEVIASQRGRFEVVALVANRSADLLHAQALQFRPRFVGLGEAEALKKFRALPSTGSQIVGETEVHSLAALPEVDVVVAAIVGAAGLRCVETALCSGKKVALANKESLVTAGPLVTQAMQGSGAQLLPVDSEHSAIFQALQGAGEQEVSELTLTASGGPFWRLASSELDQVTPAQAVKHPRWSMGAKISVDSASMMNKALELIEAHWLFGLKPDRIKVLLHPQSIVHSLVNFIDGSQLAQLSVPDMKGPIAFAMAYPHGRLPGVMQGLDLAKIGNLEFFELDSKRFPAVDLARQCLAVGPAASAVFNMANEAAVGAFLAGRMKFTAITPFVERMLSEIQFEFPASFEGLHAVLAQVTKQIESRL